jgi:hypothetical protein
MQGRASTSFVYFRGLARKVFARLPIYPLQKYSSIPYRYSVDIVIVYPLVLTRAVLENHPRPKGGKKKRFTRREAAGVYVKNTPRPKGGAK